MDAEQQTSPKGASLEDRAANALNAVMIMLLSTVVAAFVIWSAAVFLQRTVADGADFEWTEILLSVQFVSGLPLLVFAAFGVHSGYRMLIKPVR